MNFSRIFFPCCCLLFFPSCEPEETPISEIIQLNVIGDSAAFADGSSTFTLRAEIPEMTAKDKRKIKFETTVGMFVSNSNKELEVEADEKEDDKLYVEVKLKAPIQVSEAIITAKILDYSVEEKISFERALPTRLLLTSDVPAISGSFPTELTSEAFLNATISSETGLASSGTMVDFIVQDETGNLLEDVRIRNKNNSSNGTGNVSGYLSVGNLNLNPQTIKIIFKSQEFPTVRDSLLLEVF